MEALASFTFLSENLPVWISRLNNLSNQVAERHVEFTRLSQIPSSTTRKRKTGSTESLRPNDVTENDHAKTPPQAMHIDIDPDNKKFFRDVREARRKRRSGSLLSGVSGPQKYRTRMSMIIYYDSAIQEGFETLVRNIGSARNSLKKGRHHISFKARIEASRMEDYPSASRGKLRHPIGQIEKSNTQKGSGTLTSDLGVEAFDNIDKYLEVAQSLCELGAHQFLRDGDCSDEVQGVKERFENSLRIAMEQVDLLSAGQKELEREEQSSEPPAESQEVASVIPVDEKRGEHVGIEIKAHTGEPPALHESFPAVGAIEVDDESDAGSIHIDLSAFRSARRSWKKG